MQLRSILLLLRLNRCYADTTHIFCRFVYFARSTHYGADGFFIDFSHAHGSKFYALPLYMLCTFSNTNEFSRLLYIYYFIFLLACSVLSIIWVEFQNNGTCVLHRFLTRAYTPNCFNPFVNCSIFG